MRKYDLQFWYASNKQTPRPQISQESIKIGPDRLINQENLNLQT